MFCLWQKSEILVTSHYGCVLMCFQNVIRFEISRKRISQNIGIKYIEKGSREAPFLKNYYLRIPSSLIIAL